MGFNSNMRVTPIMSPTIHNSYSCRKKEPTFTAHPDFYKYNSTKSCYFRRGAVALLSGAYCNVENTFFRLFKQNDNKQKKMLIIGIGNSQEPFSYLASIKGILNDKPLKANLDLHVVDLQSKPTLQKLKQSAFSDLFDYEVYPRFAKSSFVKESYSDWLTPKKQKEEYNPHLFIDLMRKPKVKATSDRVNDEIFDFVRETYGNPQKARWDSRVQDVIKEYPDRNFDVISANNVLPYIVSENEYMETLSNIVRTLKPNAYFITDPYEFEKPVKDLGILNPLTQVYKGIYQKKV